MKEDIIPFSEIDMHVLPKVGGKNASLGEMMQHLSKSGVKVPDGFATTAFAYSNFLAQNNLHSKIYETLSSISLQKKGKLKEAASMIRQWIMHAPFPLSFEKNIKEAYKSLNPNKEIVVAVRSSAILQDLPEASFAGQQESFLNVIGENNVLLAVKKVFASLFTERSIAYRMQHNFKHENTAISAGIQRMVKSDQSVSGMMFTLDTESGFDQVILINASYGLGEAIVQGSVNPDEFTVFKPSVHNKYYAILGKKLGEKKIKIINSADQNSTIAIPVDEQEQKQYCLNDEEITNLATQGLYIEQYYGRPMDIEWAKDSEDKELYILQARPEKVVSLRKKNLIDRYNLKRKGEILTTGRSIGQKIGQGIARIIPNPNQMYQLKEGEVLVTDMTDTDWEPVMEKAAAIVTNRGGRTCHAAIVARELGIPAVVGCKDATEIVDNNTQVTVSCAEGERGYVYSGLLPYSKTEICVESMPKLDIKLCLNVSNPEQAFLQRSLPNCGVGLSRLEFIISQMIGIHPNAIIFINKLERDIYNQILDRTQAYSSPQEFYIEKLREGIATIAAAFYPKEVIFRFSDFKSYEYANLLGGKFFEPIEENPMIGFRGASRYFSENFKDCFALECEAFKRVRNKMALTNAQIMIPFVRTISEIKSVINLMSNLGLRSGENGLKVYMMCEIPSNALLANAFLDFVDGFSIGSNDLTQLTLGVDRDSELVSASFDERDPSMRILLHEAISACKQRGKYVGICGQAPSDYPELAKWLMQEGIDSISLNPDSIIETWLYLAKH